jgi:phage baseplate assembly protein gpV
MQVGTYSDGRPLNYDEATHSFDVGGTAVTSSDVMAYDDAGQVSWVNPETRTWARTYFAAPPVGVPQPQVRTVDAVPVTREPKKFPTWVVVVAVVAAVLMLGCCVAVALSAIVASDQYSETSTSSITSSTVVPEPDVSSETPSNGLSADEVAYAKSVSMITAEVASGLGEIGRILSEDAKGVFSDGDVKDALFEQIDIVKGGYDAIKELEAPERLKPAHDDLLAAMKLFDESMDELSEGVEKVDAKKVTHASQLMIEGSKKMQDATAELQDVRD